MESLELVAAAKIDPDFQCTIANMLVRQWGGAHQSRLAKLQCSGAYALLQNGLPIGHLELKSAERSSDSHCIVSTVVVADNLRGRGIGRSMMLLAQALAVRLGYSYIYLWTYDALQFYLNLGYCESQSVNGDVAVLRPMQESSINALQQLLSRRYSSDISGDGTTGKAVWLRKRIQDEFLNSEKCFLTSGAICETIGRQLDRFQTLCNIYGSYHPICWQKQIGPTCGLTALQMVIHYYRDLSADVVNNGRSESESLLRRAINLNMSSDGEIFDINNLASLAREELRACKVSTVAVADLLPLSEQGQGQGQQQALSQLHSLLHRRGLLILPYDRDAAGGPCLQEGRHAHYAVIAGMALVGAAATERHASATEYQQQMEHLSSRCCPIQLQQSLNTCAAGVQEQQHPVHNHLCQNAGEQAGVTETSAIVLTTSCFLIAVESLSHCAVIAPAGAWMRSNAQLLHTRDRGAGVAQHWVVGESGPQLAGMCVVIEPVL